MNRSVSPLFATIVILVALALGALFFMVRYRAHEAQEAAFVRAAQQQMENAMRSGQYQSRMQMLDEQAEQRRRGRGASPRARMGGPGALEEEPSLGGTEGK